MEIKKISYLGPKVDLENDCLDVFVTLENGDRYLIEVTTPKFFYTLMKKFKSNFVPPGYPYIIVSKLTDDIIRAAIQEFIDKTKNIYKMENLLPNLLIINILVQ